MKVYYSLPVEMAGRTAIGDALVAELAEVSEGTSTGEYWKLNTYYKLGLISEADIFVFATSSNSFNFRIEELASGVRKELLKAVSLGKSIYLLYTPVGEKLPRYYRLYGDPSTSSPQISGRAGSTAEFFKEIFADAIEVVDTPKKKRECDLKGIEEEPVKTILLLF